MLLLWPVLLSVVTILITVPGISISAPSNNMHLYSSNEALRLPVKGLGITTTTGPGDSTIPYFFISINYLNFKTVNI